MDQRRRVFVLSPVLRVLLGLLGAASFGTGVLAVFVARDGAGTAVLIAFGGALLVLALLGDRVESLEFGGTSLSLRERAAERLVRAEDSERGGDPATADRLRAEARALLEAAAGPLADRYGAVRGTMPPGARRTRAMGEVVARARRLSEERSFDPAEVLRWLREGGDEERVTALAMMRARAELRDFDAALAAVEHSRSAFEQYRAMRLMALMADALDAAQRERLAAALVAQRERWRFRRDASRQRLSEELLRRLTEPTGH
ncbi:hypothetical protein [Streptomyces sp. NRRL F-5053]|uniref:hypothetical protein n=1 Tax=Streptomyces sp. NRRL F-5053 TaxID=1463854 RepID=UPI0013311A03|nr:hypothetical protein [Streptomyces sp. NRRL F-5053]